MTEPFRREGDTIRVTVGAPERSALVRLPDLVAGAGDAGGRLDYRTHPDDDQREAQFRALVGDDLAGLRGADWRAFGAGLSSGRLDLDQAEAWLRVIGEARLVLAARLGIDHDGWEEEADPRDSPEMALLSYLGYLQESLVNLL